MVYPYKGTHPLLYTFVGGYPISQHALFYCISGGKLQVNYYVTVNELKKSKIDYISQLIRGTLEDRFYSGI